jgi:hypothetical protein
MVLNVRSFVLPSLEVSVTYEKVLNLAFCFFNHKDGDFSILMRF